MPWGAVIGGGLALLGSMNASDAASSAAASQERAAREAAEMSRFRPVGVTTRFGTSQFQFDPQGNVTGAGYGLSPEFSYIQNRLLGGILGGGFSPAQFSLPAASGASGGMIGGGLVPSAGGIVQNNRNLNDFERLRLQTEISNLQNNLNFGYNGDVDVYQAYQRNADQQKLNSLQAKLAGMVENTGYTSTGMGGISGGGQASGGMATAGGQMTGSVQPGSPGGGYLDQALAAMQATSPLSQGAQSLMGLGSQYLASTPQQQAQKFMQEQQALLAPQRAEQLAGLRNNLFQRGREGLAVGGEGGMAATNPELAAYYNSLAQQDREIASRATQAGMDYARFGAGLLGTGGGLLGSMYDLQSQAFSPYTTALGGISSLEGLGQNALDLGVNIGARGTANSSAAQLLQSGLNNAALSRQNSQNAWTGLLGGLANQASQYRAPQQQAPNYFGIPNYGYSTSWGE